VTDRSYWARFMPEDVVALLRVGARVKG